MHKFYNAFRTAWEDSVSMPFCGIQDFLYHKCLNYWILMFFISGRNKIEKLSTNKFSKKGAENQAA